MPSTPPPSTESHRRPVKNSTPSLPSLHLEHLFQEIHFQHFVIYTKRDGFLRRHIAKGHCGIHPVELTAFLATEKGSGGIPGPDTGAPAAWGLVGRALWGGALPHAVQAVLGAGTPCEVTVLAKTRQVGKSTVC